MSRQTLVYILILWIIRQPSVTRAAETEAAVRVGSIAPVFTLPDVKGKTFDLQAHRGEIVVLNFWAFWCDTWKAELPHLKVLAARQEEMGFRLVAVSVDGTRLREFMNITNGNLPFPVLLDGGANVSQRFRIAHVPTVIILDGAGKIRYRTFGYPRNDVVLHEITRIADNSLRLPNTAMPRTTQPLKAVKTKRNYSPPRHQEHQEGKRREGKRRSERIIKP